jgi:hypothetical protein
LDYPVELLVRKQNGAATARDMQAGVLHHGVIQPPARGFGRALEKRGQVGKRAEGAGHGFTFPPSLCVIRATSSRDRCVRMPLPMFMARGLLLTLSFTSPQSAGQPPKGSRG